MTAYPQHVLLLYVANRDADLSKSRHDTCCRVDEEPAILWQFLPDATHSMRD